MNQDEFDQMNAEIAPLKAVGRPFKGGEGTWTTSCSVPYTYKDLCKKYDISPSNALREGILMLLNQNEHFPQTEYEERQVKGVFVDHKRKFAEIIAKLK